jgi:hypothetical protein
VRDPLAQKHEALPLTVSRPEIPNLNFVPGHWQVATTLWAVAKLQVGRAGHSVMTEALCRRALGSAASFAGADAAIMLWALGSLHVTWSRGHVPASRDPDLIEALARRVQVQNPELSSTRALLERGRGADTAL